MKGLYIKAINVIFGRGDKKWLKLVKKPQNVAEEKDIFYLEDAKAEHSLDLIYPEGAVFPLPLVVNVHGGAFCYGNKEVYNNYARHVALESFVVANINYGLAPNYAYPSPIFDVVAAIEFVLKNFSDKVTRDVFIIGDSAGANVALATLAACKDAEYAKRLGVNPSFEPCAGGLSCGLYNLCENKMFGELALQRKFSSLTQRERDDFDLFKRLDKDFYPLFLTDCEDDFVQDNFKLKQTLDDLKIKNECAFYDKSHVLGHVFNYRWIDDKGNDYPEAHEALHKMSAFFRSCIKNEK